MFRPLILFVLGIFLSVRAQNFEEASNLSHEHVIEHEVSDTDNDLGDAGRTFEEICTENGFKFQEHKVTTDDGYILTVYRIPGEVEDRTTGKPPVLFQHGVFDSAYGWIIHYPDVAPAFVAARSGYDVWLGNSRGNTYSREHLYLNPDKDKEYWDFDWEEMGTKDIPAVIDYILTNTGY